MTNKKNSRSHQGAPGVQSPHAIFPKPIPKTRIGLYLALERHGRDGRTRPVQVIHRIVEILLENHKEPVPGPARLLAQRCAVKIVKAAVFEGNFLAGAEYGIDAPKDYLAWSGSIRADIMALHQLAKEGGPPERGPSLGEYLAALKDGRLVPVEKSKDE
jgi:hypothetical protein